MVPSKTVVWLEFFPPAFDAVSFKTWWKISWASLSALKPIQVKLNLLPLKQSLPSALLNPLLPVIVSNPVALLSSLPVMDTGSSSYLVGRNSALTFYTQIVSNLSWRQFKKIFLHTETRVETSCLSWPAIEEAKALWNPCFLVSSLIFHPLIPSWDGLLNKI